MCSTRERAAGTTRAKCTGSVSGVALSDIPVGEIPLDGGAQSFGEVRACLPTEQAPCTARIDATPGLTIRAGRVPHNVTSEPCGLCDESDELSDGHFTVGTKIYRLDTLVHLCRAHDGLGGIIDIEEFAARRAGSPHLHRGSVRFDRLDTFLDESRNDVGHARMKLVPGAVKIGGDEIGETLAVLGGIHLSVYEMSLLGDPVRGVGLLGIPIPEGLLTERHRGELGVGAHRSQENGLLGARFAGSFDDVGPHEQIVEIQASWIDEVVADSPYASCQVDDMTWARGTEEIEGSTRNGEVALLVRGSRHLCSLAEQTRGHDRTEESVSSGDDDSSSRPEFRHDAHGRRAGQNVPMSSRDAVVAVNLLWCVPGVGGSEEYLLRQLAGLVEIGGRWHAEVCAPRGFAARHPEVAANFPVHEAPSDCTKRPVRVALEHSWLAARTRRCDVVLHGGGTVPMLGHRPAVLTIHDVQWVDHPRWVASGKLRYLRAAVPASVSRATRIAVPSGFVADSLVSAFGTDRARIAVVRHGLEQDFGTNRTSATELRRRYSLGEGPVLVLPAITHPHKNHAFLLQLLAAGHGRWGDPELRLVFIGAAGAADAEVRQMVVDLGLERRVVMTGRVTSEDRNGLLAMAQALVFPSRYEGFGAPVIEAMSLGTPVIASDQGSLPEVVGDGGLVVPLAEDAWVRALNESFVNRVELVNRGRARASNFTAAQSARDLVDVLDVAQEDA